jgi:sodium-dependent phosphate cotransporter
VSYNILTVCESQADIDIEKPEAETEKTRKERISGSTHFGDNDFYEENPDEIGDATWSEVCRACCVHEPQEWLKIFAGATVLMFFLYFFLLGLELLGTSAKVLGGCTAGSLLGDDANPVAGLMIGILATVLLQSSSTTTSIVVSLVGGGLDVRAAIYMIMGANIGTSVTSTIVAMGHLGDGDELERAFAGATVHDMFNFLTVAIFFPLEIVTHYLFYLTKAMLPDEVGEGEKWEGPIKKLVAPLGSKIIVANKNVIKDIATGKKESCDEYYPTECNGAVNAANCKKVGLIGCDKATGECPAFFQEGADQHDDEVAGGVCLFLSLVLLIVCLVGLVTLLQKMLLGTSTRIIYKATNINGYLAMVIGMGITILVQSSSITTSTLTPLVGMGVLQLEQMYPLTLGANIGTTFTALLAALVSDSVNSLQVALCHLFFNLSGIVVWYPFPPLRNIPLNAARKLGKATRIWKGFPLVYIGVMFFLVPILLLGLSELFGQKTVGFTVLGVFLTIALFVGFGLSVYWWRFRGGKESIVQKMARRQKKNATIQSLPEDMDYLKSEVMRLKEHTGLSDEDLAKKLDDTDEEHEDIEATA